MGIVKTLLVVLVVLYFYHWWCGGCGGGKGAAAAPMTWSARREAYSAARNPASKPFYRYNAALG